ESDILDPLNQLTVKGVGYRRDDYPDDRARIILKASGQRVRAIIECFGRRQDALTKLLTYGVRRAAQHPRGRRSRNTRCFRNVRQCCESFLLLHSSFLSSRDL